MGASRSEQQTRAWPSRASIASFPSLRPGWGLSPERTSRQVGRGVRGQLSRRPVRDLPLRQDLPPHLPRHCPPPEGTSPPSTRILSHPSAGAPGSEPRPSPGLSGGRPGGRAPASVPLRAAPPCVHGSRSTQPSRWSPARGGPGEGDSFWARSVLCPHQQGAVPTVQSPQQGSGDWPASPWPVSEGLRDCRARPARGLGGRAHGRRPVLSFTRPARPRGCSHPTTAPVTLMSPPPRP